MNIKLYVWISLLVFTLAYSQEGAVIILTNDDLPTIKQTFPNILIKFYVPWCQHCKKLSPIYQELAQRLKEQNSPVRLAKIDCEKQQKGYEFGDVQQFPTVKYYSEGQVVQFDGDRTLNYIYKWITKRYKSPITKITQQQYQSLNNRKNEVKVIYWGSLSNSRGSEFTNLAYYDHYNYYYHLEQIGQEEEHTLEIIRPFDKNIREKVQEGTMQNWVRRYDRPLVVDLDQRSIFSVFVQKRQAVLFFLESKNSQKKSIFEQVAKKWRKDHSQLFIIVEERHEDYFGLMEYLQMNPLSKPIVYINSQESRKYIISQIITSLKEQAILEFLRQVREKIIPGLPLENEHHHHHDQHHDHHHQHDQHHDHDHDHDHSHSHDVHEHHSDCGCKNHKQNHIVEAEGQKKDNQRLIQEL